VAYLITDDPARRLLTAQHDERAVQDTGISDAELVQITKKKEARPRKGLSSVGRDEHWSGDQTGLDSRRGIAKNNDAWASGQEAGSLSGPKTGIPHLALKCWIASSIAAALRR
jgi:hypothetical protein